ncbi:2-keto-3-deoxygluconate kinase [Mesorhizobium sp. J18]|uniref:sugar kinase n=1 Tax=Mesorhizobium sp. J18 TaxID=935263 RepID=UPI001199E065|nr:sugar kinase [Mesorhizobium sp. J18]TWH01202.1 2-keto-3-deoxygluconate kinase [Mesorhizobium sp. J18]
MKQGVVSVGECMLELSGGEGGNWRMGHAGDTFNTLWTIRALTKPETTTDYLTAFGDDPFSKDQIAFFRQHGIGTAASPVIPGACPGMYAISLNGAERSFTYWRSEAAARRLADDPDALAKSLQNRGLIYFSGITLAILKEPARATLLSAIREAREAGTRIAFDPNYRARLWPSRDAAREAISAALTVTDIALPTFPDESDLFDDDAPAVTAERLRMAGVSEIAVKDGEKPAFVSHQGGLASIPAIHVSDAIDTTGAGDSFNGAYLAARLAGIEPKLAATKAHRVAAAVVRVHGALAPFELLQKSFGE